MDLFVESDLVTVHVYVLPVGGVHSLCSQLAHRKRAAAAVVAAVVAAAVAAGSYHCNIEKRERNQ